MGFSFRLNKFQREKMNIKQISDNIGYIEATDNPLSADIGIIKTPQCTWLYDVGNDINNIKNLTDKYNVVLSHFHLDHIGNLSKLNISDLYVPNSHSNTGQGNIVEKDIY